MPQQIVPGVEGQLPTSGVEKTLRLPAMGPQVRPGSTTLGSFNRPIDPIGVPKEFDKAFRV